MIRSRRPSGARPRTRRYSRNNPSSAMEFDPFVFDWTLLSWSEDPDWTDRPAEAAAVTTWPNRGSDPAELTQGTSRKRPVVYTQDGVTYLVFDGSDDFLACPAFAAPIAQPYTIVAMATFSQSPTAVSDFLFDGIGASNRGAVLTNASGNLQAFAGTLVSSSPASSPGGALRLWRLYVDGASSRLYVNETSVVAGDIGAQTLTGLTVATDYLGTALFCNLGAYLLVGVIPGDISTDPDWANFVTAAYDRYPALEA